MKLRLGKHLRKHLILVSVIAFYCLYMLFLGWYISKTGDDMEWASLLLLCPGLLGIAAGMYRSVKLHPEKHTTLRPVMLIALCVFTSGVCIVQTVINFFHGAA